MTPKEVRKPGSSHLPKILELYARAGPRPQTEGFCVIFSGVLWGRQLSERRIEHVMLGKGEAPGFLSLPPPPSPPQESKLGIWA